MRYANDLMSTRISVFYSGQKNGSYSVTYNGDLNTDGMSNDLIYIPKSKEEMNFMEYTSNNTTFTLDYQNEAFCIVINQDPYLSKHKREYA